MLETILSATELRVLGSLIEKEATTPEYYPLTLNALIAACNQKTNRWPVTSYDEEDVTEAVRGLRARRFAAEITGAGMRVPKYAQRFTETLNLGRRETAVFCVLALRGPQTLGEIKDRTERLHNFGDIEELESLLKKLTEAGTVFQLPRMPGQKEPRFAQLFGGPVDQQNAADDSDAAATGDGTQTKSRLSLLEAEVAKLREEVNELRRQLEAVL